MSYRSFKRVLGETNLERKCLILFTACLLLLITGAFWYAERNAEYLVAEITKKSGEGFYSVGMLQYHHPLPFILSQESRPGWLEFMGEMERDLVSLDYEWEILIREGSESIAKQPDRTRYPTTHEKEIMDKLERQLIEQLSKIQPVGVIDEQDEVRPLPASEVNVDQSSDAPLTRARSTEPLAGETSSSAQDFVPPIPPVSYLDARRKKYVYYQPVYWKESCIICHEREAFEQNVDKEKHSPMFLPKAREPRSELRGPLRVVKVTLPSKEAETAMIKSRSILLATAIITVFLAVITLYLVVRYVVVKPLNHLRFVSDEISRGNTDLRADIQTNDEFEELGASFNRMLRHLIDTQEELRNVNTDLDTKLDQLAQANMQLHEMNRLKSDFLANMSHELRTPLNSIIGFSDVLKGIDALNEKQQRYVDNIGKSGRVLLEMINDILDLAKMESGKMDVRLTDFLIGPIVHAQSDLVRALTEEKNIDLEVQVDPELPPLHQDQGKVQQILTNLLSNAIKFTPEGGRITVTARRGTDGDLLLTVADTGVGIAEQDRQIIFEKFRQGSTVHGSDNLTREFSGTGLGLSIVRELCRLLGGEIYFESELGKGSTFTAQLPWHRKEQPRLQTSLSARLDEMSKQQRSEMMRGAVPTHLVRDNAASQDETASQDLASPSTPT